MIIGQSRVTFKGHHNWPTNRITKIQQKEKDALCFSTRANVKEIWFVVTVFQTFYKDLANPLFKCIFDLQWDSVWWVEIIGSIGDCILKRISACRFQETSHSRLPFFGHRKLNGVIVGKFTDVGDSHESWCWKYGSFFNLIYHFFLFTFSGVAVSIISWLSFSDIRIQFWRCGTLQVVIFCATQLAAVDPFLSLSERPPCIDFSGLSLTLHFEFAFWIVWNSLLL